MSRKPGATPRETASPRNEPCKGVTHSFNCSATFGGPCMKTRGRVPLPQGEVGEGMKRPLLTALVATAITSEASRILCRIAPNQFIGDASASDISSPHLASPEGRGTRWWTSSVKPSRWSGALVSW